MLNESLTNNHTADSDNQSSVVGFYMSVALIFIPGILTNAAALGLIVRDIRKAVIPAIVLLFALCTSDLTAVVFSCFYHATKLYVKDISYGLCAFLSIPHVFFRMYAGILNGMMAVDRVLAICLPFYYRRVIEVSTWKAGCIFAAIGTAFISCFPLFGLGTMLHRSVDTDVVKCNSVGYQVEPVKRVFVSFYILVGMATIVTIMVCNAFVIRTTLLLKNRVASLSKPMPSDMSSSTENSTAAPGSPGNFNFEMAFAKLMGALATVYLICCAPHNILILVQVAGYQDQVHGAVRGLIHMMSGITYTIDPIVYILIRKSNRKRIVNFFCKCNRDEVEFLP